MSKIDRYALAMEIAMACESGKKVDFNELAPKVGSASGNSLRICWTGHKKAYMASASNGTDAVLSPVSTEKVQKTSKKQKTPGAERSIEKESPVGQKGKRVTQGKKFQVNTEAHAAEGANIKKENDDSVNLGREMIGVDDDKSGLWAQLSQAADG